MADRLREMRAFVAVCDAHGFAPAARRLGVAPSAITRLIASLEVDLGAVLLQRTTRAVKLTDAGARFLERCRRILADVEEAELAAQNERGVPRGRLIVSAPLLFGRIHVAPIASIFLDQNPEVQLDLSLSDRIVNLVEEGVDVAVRIGHLADSTLIARRIGFSQRILVASSDYLEQHELPTKPEDLASHSLIAFHTQGLEQRWRFEHSDRGAFDIPLKPRFSTNSADVAIEHAMRGGGIASVFRYQVASPIRNKRLLELLPEYAPPPLPIHALFPTTRLLSTMVRAFLTALEENAHRWSHDGSC
jgi:DNA-binding transcriptional LysR family regulator